MTDLDDLVRLLTLSRLGGDEFEGANPAEQRTRIYGGQLLGQALAAAQQTVDDARPVHSLHAYFLAEGDPAQPVRYEVERTRDGRSFSARRVVARQGGRAVFSLLCSLQAPEEGLVHQDGALPADLAPPERCPSYQQWIGERDDDYAEEWRRETRPYEIRYVDPPSPWRGTTAKEHQYMWIRTAGALPDDPALHAAVLAYLSDKTLVDNVLLPHGRRWGEAEVQGASLDHAMWFHRPVRADQWLVFDQWTQATGGGRGLARGDFYTAAGELGATCLQEGLIRIRA
ncbi:MAG: acyl-CoA thioesterase [Acidimicrobiales bacterium]